MDSYSPTQKEAHLLALTRQLMGIFEKHLTEISKSKTIEDTIYLFFGAKILKSTNALLILCKAGYGEDAAVIARSLFEMAITVNSLAADTTGRLMKRFIAFDTYQSGQIIEYYSKKFKTGETKPPEGLEIEEVQKKAAQVEKDFEFKPKRDWSEKSLFEMAKDVGLSHPYETIYFLMCNIAHTGPKSVGEYIKQVPGTILVNFDPAETWVEASLVACFDFSEMIVKTVTTHFKIEIDRQLKPVRAEFDKTLNG